HQNISLGSTGMDRVRSLRKIPTRLHGTNFCTSSARFAPSFVRQPNGPKCTQIVQNTLKHQFRVELLHFWARFAPSFITQTKRSSMHPNRTKHTKTLVYGPLGWIGCVRCEKFRRDFVAQT